MSNFYLSLKLSLISSKQSVAYVARSKAINDLILLKTKNTTAIYGINDTSMVHLYYYGNKLNNATYFKNYNAPQVGAIIIPYSGQTFTESAVQVIQAEGLLSTKLKYISHTTKKSVDNIEKISMLLKNYALPFFITLNFKVYL